MRRMQTIEEKRIKIAPHLLILILGVMFFAFSQIFNPATGLESTFLEAFFVISLVSIILIAFFSFIRRENILESVMGRRWAIITEAIILGIVLLLLFTRVGFTQAGAFERGNIVYISLGLLGALALYSFNMQGRQIVMSYENSNIGRDLMIMGLIVLIIFVVKFTFEVVAPFNYLGIPFRADAAQPLTMNPAWKFTANFFAGFIENSALIGVLGGLGYWLVSGLLKGYESFWDPKRLLVAAIVGFVIALLASVLHTGLYDLGRDIIIFAFILIFFSIVSGVALVFTSLLATSLAHGFIDGLVSLQQSGLNDWALGFGLLIAALSVIGFVIYVAGRLEIGGFDIDSTRNRYRVHGR
jgi:hypothetical protein